MSKNQQLSLASMLLVVAGIVMVWLGASHHIAPPTVTGIGFFVAAWGLQAARR